MPAAPEAPRRPRRSVTGWTRPSKLRWLGSKRWVPERAAPPPTGRRIRLGGASGEKDNPFRGHRGRDRDAHACRRRGDPHLGALYRAGAVLLAPVLLSRSLQLRLSGWPQLRLSWSICELWRRGVVHLRLSRAL